jgi:hypothetical protein
MAVSLAAHLLLVLALKYGVDWRSSSEAPAFEAELWATVPQGELLSGSHEESMYRDMLNEAVASSISEGRGMGIKEVILKDLNELRKKQ